MILLKNGVALGVGGESSNCVFFTTFVVVVTAVATAAAGTLTRDSGPWGSDCSRKKKAAMAAAPRATAAIPIGTRAGEFERVLVAGSKKTSLRSLDASDSPCERKA